MCRCTRAPACDEFICDISRETKTQGINHKYTSENNYRCRASRYIHQLAMVYILC